MGVGISGCRMPPKLRPLPASNGIPWYAGLLCKRSLPAANGWLVGTILTASAGVELPIVDGATPLPSLSSGTPEESLIVSRYADFVTSEGFAVFDFAILEETRLFFRRGGSVPFSDAALRNTEFLLSRSGSLFLPIIQPLCSA